MNLEDKLSKLASLLLLTLLGIMIIGYGMLLYYNFMY
jgi:hypothetical protein